MSVTPEEVRKNILTCFGDDFQSRNLDRYAEIGVLLGNGDDERMNAALTALNERILAETPRQRDLERITEYLEARLAVYRKLNKGGDRDASVDPRRLESYRDLEESKPPSARGVFGAALREIEPTRAPAAPAAAPARTVTCRCYITTAVCEALGLPDDCETLALLRAFRDTVLARTEDGRQEIAQYYTTAPAIVAAIDARPDAERVYRALMETVIAPAAADILAGRHDEARHRYRRMVERLATSADPWSAVDGS
ncbi:MAG TPA: CFI-box-CTERM domain-containing protein [Longimicrobiales bacterium]|nr:CFI-box-CTERM domain-containing protein [Longimicrobiales bacterium]